MDFDKRQVICIIHNYEYSRKGNKTLKSRNYNVSIQERTYYQIEN